MNLKVSHVLIFGFLFANIWFISCTKKDPINDSYPILPSTPFVYAQSVFPAHIQKLYDANVGNFNPLNPITDHGATLGRVLFYDTRLSKNNKTACASCHKQAIGFTDDAALSEGFLGGKTRRNSMSLLNIGFHFDGKMFWDERAASLEEQVLIPIQDSVEMGMSLTELLVKLKSTPYYAPLFKNAFGSEEITTEKIAKALAQFVRSIITYKSKYDAYLNNQQALTAQEKMGLDIFNGKAANGNLIDHNKTCLFCHSTDLQLAANGRFENDPINPDDQGIGEITKLPGDQNRFKTPSLRNVAQSAPYLHNGSIKTLEELLVFHGRTEAKIEENSAQNIAAVVAFLNTLTDESILIDKKYSNPFQY